MKTSKKCSDELLCGGRLFMKSKVNTITKPKKFSVAVSVIEKLAILWGKRGLQLLIYST